MALERKIITEFIQLYKEFPCLWDTRQVIYTDKDARDQAYDVLLEKYKQLHEDATVLDVKRKLENMRTTFKREHRKILYTRLDPGALEHVPHLWYYKHLTFLNEVSTYNLDPDIKQEYKRLRAPRLKRARPSTVSTIYLQEQNESDFVDSDNDNEYMDQQDNMTSTEDNKDLLASATSIHVQKHSSNEPEAFGTVVGLQLKELNSVQRAVAEKLISDVIFLGRMNKLSMSTNIAIDTDRINP